MPCAKALRAGSEVSKSNLEEQCEVDGQVQTLPPVTQLQCHETEGQPEPNPEAKPKRLQGESIEVVARHAIQGTEVKIVLPKRAKFKHVKRALAKVLGGDEVVMRGQLMTKDGGVYSAFKDIRPIGDVRNVLVVCADFGSLGENADFVTCGLDEEEISEDEEPHQERKPALVNGGELKAVAFTRTRAIELQKELCDGFADGRFQDQLADLRRRRANGALAQAAFTVERQELFLSVQSKVLPRYGFEGTTSGVYKMMGAMGPFVKDPEFMELAKKINEMLGVESPPSTWDDLAKSCKKLDTIPAKVAEKKKSVAPMRPNASRFGLGFSGLSAFSAPPPRSVMPSRGDAEM